MAQAKSAGKSTEAAASKKAVKSPRDYGVKVDTYKAPNGFKKAVTNDIFNFKKFGDKFGGKFVDLETIGKGKKKSTVLKCTDASGAVIKCFASAHILKQMEMNNIKKGMEIMIVFVDVVNLTGGRTLKIFEIYYK